jgi:hypothetical protein
MEGRGERRDGSSGRRWDGGMERARKKEVETTLGRGQEQHLHHGKGGGWGELAREGREEGATEGQRDEGMAEGIEAGGGGTLESKQEHRSPRRLLGAGRPTGAVDTRAAVESIRWWLRDAHLRLQVKSHKYC